MSAYIVDKTCIDGLVDVATSGPIDNGWQPIYQPADQDKLGRMLWSACQQSVAYHYPRDNDGEWPGPSGLTLAEINAYTFALPANRLAIAKTIETIKEYEYQSCERPDWETSGPYLFCKLLRARVVEKRPGYTDNTPVKVDPFAAYPAVDTDRNAVVKRIRTALRDRSGKAWSVKRGSGTAGGWITISCPPAREGCAARHDFEMFRGSPRYAHCTGCDVHRNEPGIGRRCLGHTCTPDCYGAYITPEDSDEIGALLGLDTVHCQGVSVMDSNDAYREYVDRAEGRTPRAIAQPYWD